MQEITLAGLYRGGFFDKAAFYGGTCLRIFHELPRFSEEKKHINSRLSKKQNKKQRKTRSQRIYAYPYLWKDNKSDMDYQESWDDPRLPKPPTEELKIKSPKIPQKNRGRKR